MLGIILESISPTGAPTEKTEFPVQQLQPTTAQDANHTQYIEITDSCGPYYQGTCVNARSGPGEQYRSVILYESDENKAVAEKVAKDIQNSLTDGSSVVTQIVPLGKFFPAEGYHQNYFKSNTSAPYCQLIIEPKIEKVRKRFAQLVKQ